MWYFTPKEILGIHFEISNYCNAACPECPRADPNEIDLITGKNRFERFGWIDTHFLSLDVIKKTFNQTTTPNLQDIYFCGCFGDAVTHPKLIDILEYFISEFPKISIWIHTNGGLKTTKYWVRLAETLKKSYYHEVVWGIDGLEDTNHIYRVGVNWKKLQDNFRAFNAAGGISTWQFIVFPHNYHQLEEVKKVAKKENFKEFKRVISFRYSEDRDLPDEFKHISTKNEIENEQEGNSGQGRPDPQPVFHNHNRSIGFENRDIHTGKILTCDSQQRHNVFVFSEGTVWPCSKLGFNGAIASKISTNNNCKSIYWEREHAPRKSNDLHHHSLEEIMSNSWWNTVYQSHKTGDMCNSCTQQCGSIVDNKQFYETADVNFHERL